jgi:hypothetical protein
MKKIFVLNESGVKKEKQSSADDQKQYGPPDVTGGVGKELVE